MEIQADIIEFKVPVENNKTLFVWNILPGPSEVWVYESVYAAFSHFGALFSVRICPNAAVVHPGYYAIVKFYSAAHAGRAQEATNNTGVFQEAPLKVRLCTQQNPSFLQNVRPLSSTKCYDLANYYLGFNGWSLRIVMMKDISQLDEKENLSLLEEVQTPTLKYGCIVELIFTEHLVRCRGYGVAQEFVEKDADPLEKITKRAKLQKWAKERAVADAFQRVLLIVLGNGKVAVECRPDPDAIVPDDEASGIIQVADITWSQFDPEDDDDELLADITLNLTSES
ncbi:RAD52 motif-containing protein 1 [Erpetoichthys calabaricus]|uniref:RAD52 motif-containing protein 1 n=1 Tax=Erpetoichthys calabaricus TaxID=27687 RepID=UPI0022344CCE|nr:RAD52 motif-containing protein 1 [Erpetoichthys calabaricus]